MMTASRLPRTASDQFRSILWRLGRRLYCYARRDLRNSPEINGEYWILDQILESPNRQLVLLDVGANKGEWTTHALTAASRRGVGISVYAFEPSSRTRAFLENRLSGDNSAVVRKEALSSLPGNASFYSGDGTSGTNSLSDASGPLEEEVTVTTLDAFLAQEGIDRVDVLKIDTEGFDLEVMRGGERSLTAGVVELVQFEYNWRWLINHAALRDVFEFIRNKPYRLGKLTERSIELYEGWHFEMDRFFENNYVLVRKGSRFLEAARLVRFDESNCPRNVDGDQKS